LDICINSPILNYANLGQIIQKNPLDTVL